MGLPEFPHNVNEQSRQVEQLSSKVILYAGKSNTVMSNRVGRLLGLPVIYPVTLFSDGESHAKLPSTIGYDTFPFVIQSTCPPHVERYQYQVELMLDAIRRSSGSYLSHVTAIFPYLGYARQERKDGPRVPIAAKITLSDIENARAGRIMTIDVHNSVVEGFVNIPFDNLFASYIFLPILEREGIVGPDLCVFSPDMGGFKKAEFYNNALHGSACFAVNKIRSTEVENCTKALGLFGDIRLTPDDIKGKNALIVDDLIDTAGSIIDTVSIIRDMGVKSVFVIATHGVFSGPAVKRMVDALDTGAITQLYVTDTIPQNRLRHPNRTVLSVAPLIAEYIKRTATGRSVEDLIFKITFPTP